ncbi:hypothetical protein GOP47_0014261 [Adiantum capillus-veneris]|uniref:Uncharacterized protein n=1 Tax=Adiantum capillus-veneris TaxID=13818 RepID=A0A9D4UM99_ADICA|nr:hypothetical protein GOP47_0014261 [Adiantum capillus-veneris]
MVREKSGAAFYEGLRSYALAAPSSPVLIFPSTADTDALCALKIATHLLAQDSIRYSVYPVASFNDIHSLIGTTLSTAEPFVALLINWGCSRDLRRLLKLSPVGRIFVVDSHRPIHLHNLSARNRQVTVLYSGEDESQADIPYGFDLEALSKSCDLSSDSDRGEDLDEEEQEEETESEYEDGDVGGRKRRRTAAEGVMGALLQSIRKNKSEYYRMGTFHGRPAGCLLYDIAHALHKNNNELLWLACVSLTDQFVHERLSLERYQAGVMELEQHINGSGNLEMITSVTLKDGTKVRVPDVSRISYEDEPRLMLLREWNLYDSMICSSYVATKLKTWSDNGMKRLRLLLAKMGIALVECQQKFQYMSSDMKRRMKEEFQKLLPEYGLSDLYYRSFQRLHGYSSKVSAADVVYGVTALLESWGGSHHSDHFWNAYKALSLNNLEDLQIGMQRAISTQRATLRQGSLAITKKGYIKSARGFRWLKLEDSSDAELLAHPLSLTKLCYFLMDALKEKGARAKPLICAARRPSTCASKMVLIVGVCSRPRLGAEHANRFGMVFRSVAQDLGATFTHDAFESSWIELDVASVNAFMIRISERL